LRILSHFRLIFVGVANYLEKLPEWRVVAALGCTQCGFDAVIARDIKWVHGPHACDSLGDRC
jgi:hypothetical protein